MGVRVNPGRGYDSPRRREQAAETRRKILDAAEQLFCEHGYAATTMPAIAAQAGVALKTVYLAFGTKAGVLHALWDVRLGGDDQPILDALGSLAPGVDVTAATDLLWTLNHPDTWHLLARRCGWTASRYEQWVSDTLSTQLVDQPGCVVRSGQLGCTAAPAARFPCRAGEQDADRGQVRQDLVFADVGVPRSARAWAGGAGVAVAAPVGGLAVGPG